MEDIITAVIDIGSGVTKAGFAGDDEPKASFPTIIGRPKASGDLYYVGDEAFANFENSTITYPIEHGIVKNWDDLEKIWQHTFDKVLKVQIPETPILLTQPPMIPKSQIENLITMMLEKFSAPATCISMQPLLSLYASGRTTGTVVDSGDGLSQVISIFEGYAIKGATRKLSVGGRDITDYLMNLLNEKGYHFSNSFDREVARDIKEKLCYIAPDFEKEWGAFDTTSSFFLQKTYQLPNGKKITIGKERFAPPEVLFQPSLLGMESMGIHEMTLDSIMSCPTDVRKDLCGNIVLSGGSTMFPEFANRLERELIDISNFSREMVWRLIAPPERKISCWIGGSILGSLMSNSSNWITKEEYDESGPAISRKTCFID